LHNTIDQLFFNITQWSCYSINCIFYCNAIIFLYSIVYWLFSGNFLLHLYIPATWPKHRKDHCMNNSQLSIKNALNFSWQMMRKNRTLMLQTSIPFIINIWIIQHLSQSDVLYSQLFTSYRTLSIIIALIANNMIFFGMFAGLTTMSLALHDGKNNISIRMIFQSMHYAFLLFCAFNGLLIVSLLCAIALIIPGLIIFSRCSFFTFFMVDQHTNMYQSFKASWRMTGTMQWKIMLITLLSLATVSVIKLTALLLDHIFLNQIFFHVIINVLYSTVLSFWLLFCILLDAYVYRTLSNPVLCDE
jgi:hypothetical protein